MKRDKHLIYGIHITDRMHKVPAVQTIFSEYGCYIKTRLGLHHVDDNVCSPRGLILLEMHGDDAKCKEMAQKLAAVEGVEVKCMEFDHPD